MSQADRPGRKMGCRGPAAIVCQVGSNPVSFARFCLLLSSNSSGRSTKEWLRRSRLHSICRETHNCLMYIWIYIQRTAIPFLLSPTILMSDDIQPSTHANRPSALSPEYMSLIWTTIRNCHHYPRQASLDNYGWEAIARLRRNQLFCISLSAACGDEQYLSFSSDMPSWLLDKVYPSWDGELDEALRHRICHTTPEIRLGTLVWMVIMDFGEGLCRQSFESSDWRKWDVQGRAITVWADTLCQVLRSKTRPSDAIATDDNALSAFQSAMEQDGHRHHYRKAPDVGAWLTMRAVLSTDDLVNVHWNDEDDCPTCDTPNKKCRRT
ncbi:hypothetical protein DFH06DRAFT_364423 [Mycena polygramma]|nr:hypothetical protein DFH06DRAFT_364423 [Mycena polygramma]